MVEFFQTRMGQRYYESTAPRIASALERIADNMEKAEKQPVASAEEGLSFDGITKAIDATIPALKTVDPRFDVSEDNRILCKNKEDADCIAEFLRHLGLGSSTVEEYNGSVFEYTIGIAKEAK